MSSRKQEIIETATHLFAYQGFEKTTTRQIIQESETSDPLLYYHFKSKDDLYTQIVDAAFKKYFTRLESLPLKTSTEFEKIENLTQLHFDLIKDMPEEIHLVMKKGTGK